ncbi:uncharacterized protein LOC133733791 [Rosa rugosa]|uniref:uncharacterized protein LOC133733791 n=1 Tax=Rosa rugosa TaxID=74645 RepID=UPI002B405808|nr:uncharacterized protein LOC133733791 [Rosa rugosa]
MSASIAGRTTILRAFCRAAATTTTTTTTPRISRTTCLPSIRSNSAPRCPTSRLLRRELSSLQPLHSSIAAACLVSRLPNLAASSSEGRFVNYLSPI